MSRRSKGKISPENSGDLKATAVLFVIVLIFTTALQVLNQQFNFFLSLLGAGAFVVALGCLGILRENKAD